ncbi:MAG: hypothetical protein ACP5T4_02240 [Candidatus Micrarchaeia archaeon]
MQVLNRDNVNFGDLAREEWLSIIFEIGFDEIGSATSFVEYFCERYGESKSTIWYRLKRLKERHIVDFSERGEEPKPLSLTLVGRELFRQTFSRTVTSKAMATSIENE